MDACGVHPFLFLGPLLVMARLLVARSNRGTLLPALLLTVALAGSVFFQGFEVVVFGVVQALLLICLAAALWRRQPEPVALSRNAFAWAITLFWGWLAVTLLWTPVWHQSVFDFWWIGTLPLAYWAYSLSGDHDQLWRWVGLGALVLGVVLALYGLVQLFAEGETPHSVFLNINSHAALLNLIALPLAGHLLADNTTDPRYRYQRILLWAVFLLLVLGVALTKSRGATISQLVGLGVVGAVAWRAVPARRLLGLTAVVAAAYLFSVLEWRDQMVQRFADLSSPLTVGSMAVRFQIWQQTLEMIHQSPWWGIGLGLFSLVYPAYRLPQENSAGYLVHNDYLQLWLEAGLPGLLLLLVAMAAIASTWFRVVSRPETPSGRVIELTGLFAGLLAVALHSTVDFNLHVLTILILGGVLLGRLRDLASETFVTSTTAVHLFPGLSKPVYRTLIALFLAFPLLYFLSISLAVHENERARALAGEGWLDQADAAFRRAFRFYPLADNVLTNHADLYRHVLTQLPKERIDERREVFNRARDFLDRAEALNPYRTLTFLVRAQLFEQNLDLVGDGADTQIEGVYERALALNPRFYRARYLYAKFLESNGRPDAARRVLEEGLSQYYLPHEDVVPYFAYTVKLLSVVGDQPAVTELNRRIEEALLGSGWRRIPRPENVRPMELPGSSDMLVESR
jgi:O-antigen ligase